MSGRVAKNCPSLIKVVPIDSSKLDSLSPSSCCVLIGFFSEKEKAKILNNTFITLGATGVINTSTDGTSWTRRTVNQTLGNNYQINAVGFGNGVYVAVGDGEVFVSSDSITWDQRTSGTLWRLTSILFDTNIFIKIGYDGSIYTSESGTSWTQSISGTRNNLYDLTVVK